MIYFLEEKDIWKIQKVAHTTWPLAFDGILKDAQLYYMLDLMYTTASLQKQLKEGHLFYSYEEDGVVMGFVGIKIYDSYLKIHKIYIIPDFQGKSIGKKLINHVIEIAKTNNLESISLNVNRYNKAVTFYEHLGFVTELVEDIDIGNGYLMEDYRMRLTL